MSRLPSELLDGLRLSLGDWSTARTLPAGCYTSADVYDLEQEVLFRRGWVGLGRSDRWKKRGDYAAVDIGGTPVVVVRDGEGELRALANVCSHRSSQIVVGQGNAERLRCPFHYWTYDLDGRLMAAPSMGRTEHFKSDMAQLCLASYRLAERHGFVLISLEDEPPDVDEWLGDLGATHQDWLLGELVTTRRREFTVDCNWKGFAEVFNEYYHLPYVHSSSIDDIYRQPDDGDVVDGAFATQFGLTDGTGGLLASESDKVLPRMSGLTGRQAQGVRYTWLFPNVMIATGAEAMWMYEVYPDGPGRTKCAQVVAVPAASLNVAGFEEKINAYYQRFDVAIDEDIPVLEQQFLGQKSPEAKQGRYSHLEPSVARFGDWYARRLLNLQ